MPQHRIVIVGGGAGGLELACKLGRRMGAEQVTLVDQQLFHIWKPSLHEVAAGTLDIHQEGLSYEMLAHDNGFTFCLGAMTGLDLAGKWLGVAPVVDEQGEELVPARQLPFDQLVFAVGSTANHYNVPGAAEFTLSLNRPADAEHFRLRMLKLLTSADLRKSAGGEGQVRIVIIGGGATGVELAAELREASVVHSRYGFRRIDPRRDVQITLLEGADRILAPLPGKVSVAAAQLLNERHVNIEVNCKVARITPQQVEDAAGRVFASDLVVWAAGIKAPDVLATLGLATSRSGQLQVSDRLLVQGQSDIYALGDCAACPTAEGGWVPPRAQAAHQQASYLVAALTRRAQGQPAPDRPYVYKDHGSLVSLGTQSSVGNLMGNLFRSTWFVQGLLARTMYVSLHLMHHQAVLGTLRTAVLALARFLVKRATPLVKLH
ncbi:pyridine nucleotide-disulfide oxidoreductase family protein [Hydrogenophaga sp. RAC07]|uniref:NAD(P)/FAD-dependent oxidoreductase n=1 Tax=Hydrogenophaga sp. RAC07 TaxID=1842537 RepID=UPI00083E5769|nr:NAD(P)/FAD-dependent oxidoreductase [Hydrogenophaga sp. RAC07]AOF84966.1 pyridine nucleotide-disulfide oxidoreductase family protein [Hydrogenophaga sp. RAC07]